MTVQEFVDGYKEIENRVYKNKDIMLENIEKYIQEHITTQYIDIEKKETLCNIILDKTMEMIINNKKIFKQNSVIRKVSFEIMLIENYTDIKFDNKNKLSEYNLLNKNNLIKIICKLIPSFEYEEINEIMDMVISDYFINNREFVSYLETKMDVLSQIYNVVDDVVNNISPYTSNNI